MPDIKTIADKADFIVNGYAFTRNGDTVLQNQGVLSDREVARISEFIKEHYQEMYLRWTQYSKKGYYEK